MGSRIGYHGGGQLVSPGSLVSVAIGVAISVSIGLAIGISGGEIFETFKRIGLDSLGAFSPVGGANLPMRVLERIHQLTVR
jgi:hypothetical protein